MKKPEQSANVSAIRAYLAGLGHPISSVQGYEVLARALGHKSKHVLAQATTVAKPSKPQSPNEGVPALVVLNSETVSVLPRGAGPLTISQMQALNWKFNYVVPLALEDLWHVDSKTEAASMRLTGNMDALSDVGFEHVPSINYGFGFVAFRVTGYVVSPEDHFEGVEDADDEAFYADLLELADAIKGNSAVIVSSSDGVAHATNVKTVHAGSLHLLQQYARSKGTNNEAVNSHHLDVVFDIEVQPTDFDNPITPFVLHELKYAAKVSPGTWHVPKNGSSVTLRFKGRPSAQAQLVAHSR
jgi:hypothetical protein